MDDDDLAAGGEAVIGSLNTALGYISDQHYDTTDGVEHGEALRGATELLADDGAYGDEDADGEDMDEISHPQILLMGLRRSGKTSILKVIFHKQQPSETLFLESTVKPYKDTQAAAKSFVNFTVWDCPGQLDWTDGQTDSLFQSASAIIFLIDAQDDYMDALARFNTTVQSSVKQNPSIAFDVFIHKVDGLTDDQKTDVQRDIHQRVTDALREMQIESVNVHVSFHLTSIYDHSVFEAFSKVVQKLVPELPTVENLLDMFIASSGIEKAFVFDINSKIYVATDSQMVDTNTYELCCDMIDVVLDMAAIYGSSCPSAHPSIHDSAKKHDEDATSRGLRSTIRLSNALILSLRQLNDCLALVFIMRHDATEKEGLIEYNFEVLKKAILDVFAVHRSMQRSTSIQHVSGSRNVDIDADLNNEVDFVAGSYERDEDYSRESTPKPQIMQNGRLLSYANDTVN